MKRVLLDTHVWIWWSAEAHEHLSRRALETLEQAKEKWISAISLWELAKLVERGRIAFSIPLLDWMNRSLQEKDVSVAPLEPEICVESCSPRGSTTIPLISSLWPRPVFTLSISLLQMKGFKNTPG